MIYLKEYQPPELNVNEILRYMGAKDRTEELNILLEECINEALPKLTYKVCYAYADVEETADGLRISNITTASKDLRKYLKKSRKTIVFAATVDRES